MAAAEVENNDRAAIKTARTVTNWMLSFSFMSVRDFEKSGCRHFITAMTACVAETNNLPEHGSRVAAFAEMEFEP